MANLIFSSCSETPLTSSHSTYREWHLWIRGDVTRVDGEKRVREKFNDAGELLSMSRREVLSTFEMPENYFRLETFQHFLLSLL